MEKDPVTDQKKQLDSWLTAYCEKTKDRTNLYLDMSLFKQVAFEGGVAAIVVDLISYITGGTYNKPLADLIHKAVALLYDRMAPKIMREEPLTSIPFKKQSLSTKLGIALQDVVRDQKHKVKKLIPPFNHVPDEIYEDDEDNDLTKRMRKADIHDFLETDMKLYFSRHDDKHFSKIVHHFTDAFRKLARADEKKPPKNNLKSMLSAKLLAINEKEEATIPEMYMLEATIRDGMQRLF